MPEEQVQLLQIQIWSIDRLVFYARNPRKNEIFFTGVRDGFRCIWAQKLGPNMRSTGAPFAVYHFHQRRSSLQKEDWSGGSEIAVGPNIIAFNQAELTGDVWLLEPAKNGLP